ncbi:MAG TPA: 6-carboxytetrahydropterin synthase, partial [Bacteroidales bacterium]|nr:6-carboxytetrahydropterin synthase [Bacteroidales bacterium]
MTQLIRLTREFTFEMAHVLEGYDGPCRNVHGHSYRLYVTVKGFPVSDSLN